MKYIALLFILLCPFLGYSNEVIELNRISQLQDEITDLRRSIINYRVLNQLVKDNKIIVDTRPMSRSDNLSEYSKKAYTVHTMRLNGGNDLSYVYSEVKK